MPEQAPKIVIIGLGFLMRYMKSCFQSITGEAYSRNVVATTDTAATIDAKQREMGIPVVHRAYLETLDRVRPDLIMFSPPPTAVKTLTENVLRPYYVELQQKNQPLPDLYAFPPDPRVGYYARKLGDEIFSVNILPNMTARQSGESPECYSVISYTKNEHLDPQKILRTKAFLEPLGTTITIPPVSFTAFLGGYVVCHLILNFAFACQDGLAERGQHVEIQQISADMLLGLSVSSQNVGQNNEKDLSEEFQAVLRCFMQGILTSYADSGLPQLKMEEIIHMQLKAFITLLQHESRESLIQDSQNHATKGGLLENATFLFDQEIRQEIHKEFSGGVKLSDTFKAHVTQFGFQAAKSISSFSDGYSGITDY